MSDEEARNRTKNSMLDPDEVNLEKCQEIKKSRAGFKSSLKKCQNKLRSLMQDENTSTTELNDQYDAVNTAWGKFTESHNVYHELLNDGDMINDSHEYYDTQQSVMDMLRVEYDNVLAKLTNLEIDPQDSASDVRSNVTISSKTSSSSSLRQLRIQQEAKITELEMKVKMLQEKQEITKKLNAFKRQAEEEELKLKSIEEQFQVYAELETSKAKVKVLEQVEGEACGLNVNATEFQPKNQSPPSKCTNSKNQSPPINNSSASSQPIVNLDEALIKLSSTLQEGFSLPKPELLSFSGNPNDYHKFIRNFEANLESNVSDDKLRLGYLIQYCTGNAKKSIEDCVLLPPSVGYQRAKKILLTRFGKTHIIAHNYIDQLVKGSAIKPNDTVALMNLALDMEKCEITLSEIGSKADLNNSENLRLIVRRLPMHIRSRWLEKACSITESGLEPTFKDLLKFVQTRANVANTMYGLDMANDQSYSKKPQTKVRSNFATVVGTGNDQKVRLCQFCGDEKHFIGKCDKFISKSLPERSSFVKEKGLCFNCLYRGHRVSECRQREKCQECSKKHHTLLHEVRRTPEASAGNQVCSVTKASLQSGAENTVCSVTKSGPEIGMSVVPVKVYNKSIGLSVDTYAFLDNGSTSSFCSEQLMNQLALKGEQIDISLTTMGKEKDKTTCHMFDIEISDLQNQVRFSVSKILSVKRLPLSHNDIPTQEDIDRWSHLQGIKIETVNADIGLLIGNDNAELAQPLEVRRCEEGGPYATRTPFGWTINGPLGRKQECSELKSNLLHVDKDLSKQLQNYFNMDFNDQVDMPEMSQQDRKALAIMESTCKLEDGHYMIGLPFKNDQPAMYNNKPSALTRLNSLKRRLDKEPELSVAYTTFMEDLLKKGYAEIVPKNDISKPNQPIWYLPHHPVTHPKKPGKVRVVFDCSAKYRDVSLNDSLLQGPDLTNSLVGVLTRFREEPVGMISDIESMFYQVRVSPEDRDLLRFLWWPNGNTNEEPQEFRMKVHIFGGVSSPSCCNFALRKTAEDNQHEYDPEIIETVKRNFYVDDCCKSTKNEERAIHVQEQLTALLKKGGFRLTKWNSNSRKVVESVAESERAASVKMLNFDDISLEKSLGMGWDTLSDSLKFDIAMKHQPPTRRGILSIVSSVYDPLGFVSPAILPAKFILQDLCRQKLGWDQPIQDIDLIRWQQWVEELPRIGQFSIPRCLIPADFGDVTKRELHHFSDASEKGYGAVSYIRQVNSSGDVHCSFVMSKSRVTPLKFITIPRLELSAATVSVRLDHMIKNELTFPIDMSYFWTDSTAVLKYIGNEDLRFKTFVANRVGLIRSLSEPSQWQHVSTNLNPADHASRGLSAQELLSCKSWLTGPEFLWEKVETWPRRPKGISLSVDDSDPEIKIEKISSLATVDSVRDFSTNIAERFSDWNKLKRCVAWIQRFIHNARHGRTNKKNVRPTIEPISVDEISTAEVTILKCLQGEYFEAELSALEREKGAHQIPKSCSIIKLNPMLVDGLLRVGGRLSAAPIPEDCKHQVILPQKSHVTKLIIEYYHKENAHLGREYILNQIRMKYWILKGNSAVRRVLSDCFDCRRRYASPGKQVMADLPVDRLTPDCPPFSFVGIDYFGPFLIKRGRSEVKRYGCIFTCLAIRAVHVEIAHSMDTDSFIFALRRFIARRGCPLEFRSDNGSNFVGAERELNESITKWNEKKIDKYLVQKGIKWRFNPPAASHHGGIWERCIRTIRKVLGALTLQQQLTDESLHTFVCEAESIINGRPITKVSEDSQDLEALTPNHLLLLRSSGTLPPGTFSKEDSYSRRRWKQVQYLVDRFWDRWLREYLPLLQERQKWLKPSRNMKVGDIVLIQDESTVRGSWPKGIVEEVYPDGKGVVRQALIRTSSTRLRRDVRKICLLEAHDGSS